MTFLYQYNAEGSLIRGAEQRELQGEFVLARARRAGVRQPLHRLREPGATAAPVARLARMHLAVAPGYNRHMLSLEQRQPELWRENARVARRRLGQSDAAAATVLVRVQEEERRRGERIGELEAEVARLAALLDTPRHRFDERAPRKAVVSPAAYGARRR